MSHEEFLEKAVAVCHATLQPYPYHLLTDLVSGPLPATKCLSPFAYYYRLVWDLMSSGARWCAQCLAKLSVTCVTCGVPRQVVRLAAQFHSV